MNTEQQTDYKKNSSSSRVMKSGRFFPVEPHAWAFAMRHARTYFFFFFSLLYNRNRSRLDRWWTECVVKKTKLVRIDILA